MGLGLRAAAARLGMSHAGLKKAADKGRVPREADGSFDLEKCQAALAQNTNFKKQKAAAAQKKGPLSVMEPPPSEGSVSYSEACRLHELVKIEERQLALDIKKGLLLPADDVLREWSDKISSARNRLLLIGAKCAPQLGITDVRKRQAIIDREIREALSSLGGQEQERDAA